MTPDLSPLPIASLASPWLCDGMRDGAGTEGVRVPAEGGVLTPEEADGRAEAFLWAGLTRTHMSYLAEQSPCCVCAADGRIDPNPNDVQPCDRCLRPTCYRCWTVHGGNRLCCRLPDEPEATNHDA